MLNWSTQKETHSYTIDLKRRKIDDEMWRMWRIILRWKWKLSLLRENKRSIIQHCENFRNLNVCRWKQLWMMRWLIQKQRSLFIKSILSQTKDETERENENNHEIENDEIENENENKQQCSKRLNKYIKTNDVKCKDDVNRLHFMRLKSWEKKLSFREEKFFPRCELDKQCCLFWSE